MSDDDPQHRATSTSFWDREAVAPVHISWMADPDVRRYINESISGDPDCWPIDWLIREYGPLHFEHALSVGCGTGALERDLILRGLCDRFDAFDGSPVAIEQARSEADRAGVGDRIHYWVGDFNEPQLPRRRYDAVFFHQSAHHVRKLEKLFRAVMKVMKPEAMLYLDENVGPSRADWDDRRMTHLRAVHRLLPPELRTSEELAFPIQGDDPSEAIRASEILPQLKIGFEIRSFRGYGGNLLAVLFAVIRPPGRELVQQLIAAEREVLRGGEAPFCAVVVARRKRGVAAALARARYFVEPKLKRIGRELAKGMGAARGKAPGAP